MDYIPFWLPCGRRVNINYRKDVMECCVTICKDKDYEEIDACYQNHKEKLIKEMIENGMEVEEENWTVMKDKYLEAKSKVADIA